MPFLLMYWKHLLAVALLGYVVYVAYDAGAQSERLKCLEAEAKEVAALAAAVEAAQADAAKANEALRQRLAKPAPAKPIREAVNANPSDCRIDPAVSAGVRQAVAEANARAAAK